MLLLVVLILLVLVLVEISSRKTRFSAPDAVTKETIFVVLPLYRPTDALGTLKSIFQNAAAPQSVRVGILEHNHSKRLTAADLYYAAQQKNQAPPFAHRIKYKKTDSAYYGAAVAREWILDNLYGGERYLLFVTQRTLLLPHWDRILLTSLTAAHAMGGHVVSQFPCLAAATGSLPSTFPVMHAFSDKNTPMFKGRLIIGEYRQPLASAMASWRCLFGSASVLRQGFCAAGLPFLPNAEADLLLSYELWARGYLAFTPSESAAVSASASAYHSYLDTQLAPVVQFTDSIIRALLAGKKPAASTYSEKLASRQLRHTVLDFLHWLRIKPSKRYVAGQTVLGLLPDHTEEEIIRKYGSLQRFQEVKERFTF